MPKDTNATAAQQHSPKKIGLPPLLIRLTRLVLSPIAAIAIVIRNLPKLTIGLLTAAGMPVTVLMTAASRKNRINQGKILERRKLPLDFSFSFRERYSARMKVMGMIASVRVSLTIVASVSAVSLPTALLQVVAAATTEEVSFTAVPAKTLVAHAKRHAGGGKEKCGQYVKEKNRGDGFCHILIIRIDDRSGSCYGGTAADRRTDAD